MTPEHHNNLPGVAVIWPTVAILVMCAALMPALAVAREAQPAEPTPVFLVATRDLSDPLFQHSVILMLPQTESPLVAGIIINKPTAIRVHELFRQAPALKNGADIAYFGGPVGPTTPSLVVRTDAPAGKAARLFDDLYVSTDPGSIAGLLKDPRPLKELRLFLGRAQWTRPQLHAEILEGAWYIVPATAGPVFSPDPRSLWSVMVQRAQLQEVDAAGVRGPNALVLLQGAQDLPAWPRYPAARDTKLPLNARFDRPWH